MKNIIPLFGRRKVPGIQQLKRRASIAGPAAMHGRSQHLLAW